MHAQEPVSGIFWVLKRSEVKSWLAGLSSLLLVPNGSLDQVTPPPPDSVVQLFSFTFILIHIFKKYLLCNSSL
jgi:hypothetical protein